jgi:1-acyl-sn-glycerol-3-phosphate acyltransferase
MRTALGVLLLTIAFPVILLAAALIVLTGWIPLPIRGARLAAWFTTLVARLAMRVFNVRYRCLDPEQFRRHTGFIFANHITYFDILCLQAILPLRYLSAAENRRLPVIGWVAQAIGTVFVNRSDRQSRAQAREQLVKAEKYPAIVMYPEGGVGPANSLQSFRYGAFEIAMQSHAAYLLAAIRYSHPDIVVWNENEQFMDTFWRLACFPGPVYAEVAPLKVVMPQPDDDPKRLAAEAHRLIAREMGVPPKMDEA